jgi:hypothetical protein
MLPSWLYAILLFRMCMHTSNVNAYASRKKGHIEKYYPTANVTLFISPVRTFWSPARQ